MGLRVWGLGCGLWGVGLGVGGLGLGVEGSGLGYRGCSVPTTPAKTGPMSIPMRHCTSSPCVASNHPFQVLDVNFISRLVVEIRAIDKGGPVRMQVARRPHPTHGGCPCIQEQRRLVAGSLVNSSECASLIRSFAPRPQDDQPRERPYLGADATLHV